MLLQEGIAEADAMIRNGAGLRHKTFGIGELQGYDGKYLEIRFPASETVKKFELTSALGNGFITLELPDFPSFIDRYRTVLKQGAGIPRQVESAQKALEPYASYLD